MLERPTRAQHDSLESLHTSAENDDASAQLRLAQLYGQPLPPDFVHEQRALPVRACGKRHLGLKEELAHGILTGHNVPLSKVYPGKVSGAWVLKGTRMPVSAIFENIEAGASIDDIMEWFDGLDREQVKAVIRFYWPCCFR